MTNRKLPRPEPRSSRPPVPVAVTLRGRTEWLAWLDRFCVAIDHLGIGIERTRAIDYALRRLAQELGLPEPPPRT